MKKADELMDRYCSGNATPEEKSIVEHWYTTYKADKGDLLSDDLLEDFENGRIKFHKTIGHKKIKTLAIWTKISVAALLMIFLTIGFYFYNSEWRNEQIEQITSNSLINQNSVSLTLSDGRKLNIGDKNIGEILEEEGLRIEKTAHGQLKYTVLDEAKGLRNNNYNTIETPLGSEYTVVLPDGSKIFLSSASKLHFPTHFSDKERKVELEGEAFFDIESIYTRKDAKSQSKKIPFIVLAGSQRVEVLGTQFNISAYNDDENIRTSLLEGSVKVSVKNSNKSAGTLLKPGQMAVSQANSSKIEVQSVDVEDIKAWKEGYFIFNNENIKDIMRKLSKWYGFKTEYIGDMSDVEFHGNYLRTKNLNNLLETMEMTNKINFKVIETKTGRTLYVIRNK